MNEKAQIYSDVIYDAQFKQKVSIVYFPLTWQGSFLLFLCWILPINMMEALGIYLFIGVIVYRMLITKKDHEVESLTVFSWAVSFIRWINSNKEKKIC